MPPTRLLTAGDVRRDGDGRPTPVGRLLQLLARERGEVGLVCLYAALIGLFSLTLPLGVQAIVGLISGGLVLQPVVLLIAFVIAGTLVTGLLQVVQLGVVERLQQRVFARLALDYTFRAPRVEFERILGQNLPESMNRFFEVVIIQKSLAKLLTESVTALLSILFGLILLTFYHPYFSIFGVVLLALLGGILWLTGRRGLETSLTESKYKYRVASWLQELARSTTVLRFAPRSRLPLERMDREVGGYVGARRAHFAVLVRQSLGIVVFKTVITGGLLVLGSLLVINRQISLGQFVASELVIVTVLAGVEKLGLGLATVYDILTSVEKAGQLGDVPLEHAHGASGFASAAGRRGMSLAARRITYAYPGTAHPVLHGVDLRVEAGECVGITGVAGSGGSTLLAVLSGLLPQFEGALTFDGVSARDVDLRLVREQIAFVESHFELFEGTIEENVSLGRPEVTAADVLEAVERVGLTEMVQTLPLGLRTPVGAASRLPTNAERKIALARALVARPRLLVFDHVFHHLEPAYKRTLLRAITDRAAGWSVLAVSHDPNFLEECDRVYVLDEGRVVRCGRYAELLDDPRFVAAVGDPPTALVAGSDGGAHAHPVGSVRSGGRGR
jgi:ABC-type bacteriocin/lantibiotic exporter with double-glycine peptidase domain